MEGLTFLHNNAKEDIESIGLVFEPNFFTGYFYADSQAKKLLAYKAFDSTVPLQSRDIKALRPLFALSFKGDYTLVPQVVFNESDAGKYLDFNTSAGAQEAEWDRIIGLESVIIYQRDKESEKSVESVFPGLRLKHGVGALLEFCRQKENTDAEVFLHQSGSSFDLAIFHKSKLLFANTIQAGHPEDVRYFLLYTLKTLELKPETPVNLLGAAAKNDEVIELLKPYMPNIRQGAIHGNRDHNIIKPAGVEPRFTSTNWAGIYASLCAL